MDQNGLHKNDQWKILNKISQKCATFERYFDEKTVIQDFDEKSKWKLVTPKTKSRPIELSIGSKEPPRPGRINSSL